MSRAPRVVEAGAAPMGGSGRPVGAQAGAAAGRGRRPGRWPGRGRRQAEQFGGAVGSPGRRASSATASAARARRGDCGRSCAASRAAAQNGRGPAVSRPSAIADPAEGDQGRGPGALAGEPGRAAQCAMASSHRRRACGEVVRAAGRGSASPRWASAWNSGAPARRAVRGPTRKSARAAVRFARPQVRTGRAGTAVRPGSRWRPSSSARASASSMRATAVRVDPGGEESRQVGERPGGAPAVAQRAEAARARRGSSASAARPPAQHHPVPVAVAEMGRAPEPRVAGAAGPYAAS